MGITSAVGLVVLVFVKGIFMGEGNKLVTMGR
jgi:hypothetical protein